MPISRFPKFLGLALFLFAFTAFGHAQATASLVAMGNVNIGASANATVTFTFSASTTISSISVVTQGTTGLDFQPRSGSPGTCTTTTYANAATCTVNVTFSPLAPGIRFGAAVLTDNSGNIYYGQITGVGVGALLESTNTTATRLSNGSIVGTVGGIAVAVDAAGNAYVADYSNNRIVRYGVDGTVTNCNFGTLAVYIGLAIDGAGNLYIADPTGNTVTKAAFTTGVLGPVVTVASGLNNPYGLTVDKTGNLYIAERAGNDILKITPAGVKTVVATPAYPYAITVDTAGTLYWTTQPPNGGGNALLQSLASGASTPTTIYSTTNQLTAITIDPAGSLFVASAYPSSVLKFTAGSTTPSTFNSSYIAYPYGLALSTSGSLFVFDSLDGYLYKINRLPADTFAATGATAVNATSSEYVSATPYENDGNAPLTLTSITHTNAVTGPSTTCSTSTPVAVNATCTASIEFAPIAHGSPQTGTINFAGNLIPPTLSITGYVSGDSTHLAFGSAPPASLAAGGNSGTVTVAVQDNGNATVTNAANSITLTVTGPSSYSQTYTVAAVNGIATFNLSGVTLTVPGSYSYVATTTGLTTASSAQSVVPAAAVTYTLVPATTNAAFGFPDNFTITAYDAYSNVATNYTGTVAITSTDSAATLPANFTLTSGTNTFAVTFATQGTQTVTATDTVNSALTKTSANITVFPVPNYIVTSSAGDTTGACTNQAAAGSTTDAACTVYAAFAAVNALNNTATTSYTPTITFASALYGHTITMSTPVSVTGNFALNGPGTGVNAITISGNNALNFLTQTAASNTTLSGLTFTAFSSTTNGAVLSTSSSGAVVTLSNATFTNNTTTANGGALSLSSGTTTITNSTFTGNTAVYAGALILNGGTANISNSTFTSNGATVGTNLASGGAIYITGGDSVTLTSDTFTSNSARTNGGAIGSLATGTLIFTNTNFTSNSALANGGAVYNTSSTITITGGAFTGNQMNATAPGSGTGGALWSTAPITITNASFINNTAANTNGPALGGAAYLVTSQNVTNATISNSLFSGNTVNGTVTSLGGALEIGGQSNLINDTFTGNKALGSGGNGGAVYQVNGTTHLYYVTITGNSATTKGGGYYRSSLSAAPTNTVISGNSAPSSPDEVSIAFSGTNYINTSSSATCSTNCTPLLSPLGNYGGPTLTMVPLPGSPLIVAAAANVNNTTTDARGFPRSTTFAGNVRYDLGAVQTNYSLAFIQQPSNAAINTNISPAPTVQLYESGTPFLAAYTPFAITAANGTLTTSSTVNAATGLQTVTAAIPTPQSDDYLTATLHSGTSNTPIIALATSSPFNITDTSAATLNFTTPPTYYVAPNGNAGIVKVGLYTSTNHLDTAATSTVTLTVTGFGYSQTYTASAVSGTATFDLSAASLASGNYTYTATAAAYTPDSAAASEIVTYPVAALVVSGPTSANPGTATAYTVTAKDGSNATITTFTNQVTLSSSDPAATFAPQTYTFTDNDNGVHTFYVTFPAANTSRSVTATTTGNVSGTQSNINVLDSIWLVNANGTISKLTESGTSVTGPVGISGNTSTLGGVAFDNAGTVWSVSAANNSLNYATKSGTGATTATGGGLNAPTALAIDGIGQIWIANSNNSISLFSNAAAPLSPNTGFTGGALSSPTGIAIDNSGNLWLSNSANNSVTEFIGAAAPTTSPIATATSNNTQGTRP